MINIRYHIVSITAVFLALGIGVALGSTFLDRATVDVLNRNIRSAENRIAATNRENEQLSAEVEAAQERDTALIVIGSEELLADHLTDVPTLVIAAPGVEGEAADALRTVLERSGADLRGTLSLRDGMLFEGEPDQDLAEALGEPEASAAELQDLVYQELRAALVAAGTPLDGEVPEDVPDGTTPSIIEVLIERDLLGIDPGPGRADDDPILETSGYRYVLLGAPDLDPARSEALLDLLPDPDGPRLAAVVVSATVPTPEPDSEAPQVPTAVDLLRGDEDQRERYASVDNVETFAGLTATVLVLEDVEEADPAPYGQADGATAVLPSPP